MGKGLRPLAIFLLFASLAGAATADEPILVVRVESLDAVTADLARFPGTAGRAFRPESMLTMPLQPFGSDTGWIDGSRPAVMALPMDGLMAGANGMIVALPFKDAAAASTALSLSFDQKDAKDGMPLRLENDGRALQARPQEGYVVVGPNTRAVREFDLANAVKARDLPAGSLSADLHLEKIAPMLRMAMGSGRQMAEQQLANAQAEAQGMSPEAMKSMVGFYFDLTDDILSNSSRLQVSLEAGADDFIVHLRLIPIPGSTLDGLQRAQKGGLPDLARFVDPAENSMTMAGQITYTTAFLEAVNVYVQRYADMMIQLSSAYTDQTGDAGMGEWAAALASMNEWTDCYRGDFAGAYKFGGENGMETVAVVGTEDAKACRKLISTMADLAMRVPTGTAGSMEVKSKEDALSYRGVKAIRTEMSFDLPEEATPAEVEIMNSMFGSSGLVSYTGLTKKMLVSATGGDAEANFKQLVDRVAKPTSSKKMSAETFAPLTVGPGVFATVSFKSMFGWIGRLGAQPETTPALQRVMALPDRSGRLVYGARFDGSGLNIELGMPFELLHAMSSSDEVEPKQISGSHP